jgi:hypothetical protein
MKRLLFCIVLAVASACAQSQQVVYQQVFTNATATGTSVVVRNIGQTYHSLTVVPSGGFCGSEGKIGLYASYDNVNFFPLGVPITPINFVATGIASTTATGAYPYVVAKYLTKFLGCTSITVTYAGAMSGSLTGSAPYTVAQDTFQYAGGRSTSTTPISSVGCGSTELGLNIYAITVTAPGGANALTVARKDGAINSYSITIPLTATTPNFVWPQGPRPFLTDPYLGAAGGVSTLVLTPAAATELDYVISYRCE